MSKRQPGILFWRWFRPTFVRDLHLFNKKQLCNFNDFPETNILSGNMITAERT